MYMQRERICICGMHIHVIVNSTMSCSIRTHFSHIHVLQCSLLGECRLLVHVHVHVLEYS